TVLWRRTAAALETVRTKQSETEAALGSRLVALAHRDWLADDLEAAPRHLEECPPAPRGPGWRYPNRMCHSCLVTPPNSGPTGRTSFMVWSPDGRYLAGNHLNFVARVWDPRTGSDPFILPGKAASSATLAFDADGRLVSSSWPVPRAPNDLKSLRTVDVKTWDMQTREVIRSFSATLLMHF